MKDFDSKKFLTPELMEKQEHLSMKHLMSLEPSRQKEISEQKSFPRPTASFVELMEWTKQIFCKDFTEKVSPHALHNFVNNRIIIDGQFLHFCEERKIKVKCLYQDSVISWKTDHNYEKFFMQGVFLIKAPGLEFLHAALFHKGNQNEDEVSFFVIASNDNYEAYVKLRNEFDEWIQERDRSNLHIRVIDGEDIPYTKDSSWDELFLPTEIKDNLKGLVENFLESRDFYLSKKIPWKRGILLYGKPGNGKTSIIRTIMSVYNFKPVTIISGAGDEAVREAFSYAEEQSPSLLYFEDLDSMLEKNVDISSFLNLMDGISAKNGMLVIATANEVKKLKANITQRPSRFDRKFEIPLPNQEMAYIYLKRWFDNILSDPKCKEIAKFAEKHEFSYAYLKEFYISSMFEALSHNRKTPTTKDIDNTLVRLVKDKNILGSDNVINTDKYFK